MIHLTHIDNEIENFNQFIVFPVVSETIFFKTNHDKSCSLNNKFLSMTIPTVFSCKSAN